jgi:phenylalanyl-tRNA synthetase beta chain
MKFTLSWLKRFLDTDATLEQITHTLTMIGLEVEEIIDRSQGLQGFEIAEIISAEKHPDADKLRVCQVNTSDGMKQIVCGAANARAGIRVVLAKPDTLIPNGNFKIKKSVIRGAESNGMLCSYEELNLPGDSEGIIELGHDAKVGESFVKYAGLDDPVIHINITPNRADALGVYGIARDLAAAGIGILKALDLPNIAANRYQSDNEGRHAELGSASLGTFTNVIIKDKVACPYFAIRAITGLDNKQSPKWLQDLLENTGIGSISPVVDVTNYISYAFGQPMHAYDANKSASSLAR